MRNACSGAKDQRNANKGLRTRTLWFAHNNLLGGAASMERVQLHKFIDLAKPLKPAAERKGMSRRDFLAAVSGTAAVTAMAPEAFARNFIDQYDADGPIARYPNPDVIALDKRFKYKLGNTPIVRLYRGTMWA